MGVILNLSFLPFDHSDSLDYPQNFTFRCHFGIVRAHLFPTTVPRREPQMPKQIIDPQQRLFGPAATAEMLGLSIHTVRAMVYAGRIASVKLGSRLLISSLEINKLIAENERPRIKAA
jgi:excisionase family DNA binding protein